MDADESGRPEDDGDPCRTGGEYIGYDGAGTFNQSGGTNTTLDLTVAQDGGSGTYTLSGKAGHTVWRFTTVLGASPTPQSQTAAAELR